MDMEKFLRQSILYDFYGELLTEHQKKIYEDVVLNDLSYTEIANAEGISRQGVYDLIKRCDKILEEYETKLRLVEKFQNAKGMVAQIQNLAKDMKKTNEDNTLVDKIEAIEQLSNAILEEF
jgi:hypothetical protein